MIEFHAYYSFYPYSRYTTLTLHGHRRNIITNVSIIHITLSNIILFVLTLLLLSQQKIDELYINAHWQYF